MLSSSKRLQDRAAVQKDDKLVSYSSDAESLCGHDSFVADYDDEAEKIDESWIPTDFVVEDDIVRVYVTARDKPIEVSKALLCRDSTYFKAALTGGFKEAVTNEIHLGERYDLFQIFRKWLEDGNLDFLTLEAWPRTADQVDTALVEIYCFADRRGVPAMGDEILEKFDKFIRPEGLPVRVDFSTIKLAWVELPETSGLCRYLLAIERDADRCNLPSRAAAEFEWLPGHFTLALLKATHDDTDKFLTASVQKQPVDVVKLQALVKDVGGAEGAYRAVGWSWICNTLGIRAPSGCDSVKLWAHMRALNRTWLSPWDASLTPKDRSSAEKECPRPLAKDFYHGAVPRFAIKRKSTTDHDRHSYYD
ncbi:hypothetical protein D6D21_04286 [Aureobasidium pullulans]|uniref:BTB domain-containing protein n=1 Tax=Aureobasidium pullulans TaxID=5580 RepID=A0AB74IYS7_AURPU|nr:hypothetical protein D6D21_04286 [Aureobasidium pullulans]